MKRVLITGMSGAGKSSVIDELAARGFEAHDLDTPDWSHWIEAEPSDNLTPLGGKDWAWRMERVRKLLARPRTAPVFVSGTSENMGQLFELIDEIVLLSVPVETLMKRLAARPAGEYGSTEDDRRKARELVSKIEPRLRNAAGHEVDTRRPTAATVDALLEAVFRRESDESL